MKNIFVLGFTLLSSFLFSYECEGEKIDPCAYDYNLFKKCTSTVFTNVEFLYWAAEANSLDYAVSNHFTPPSGDTYAIGQYKISKYDYNPGFRVAIGYFRAPKYWQALIQYSYIDIDGKNNINAPYEEYMDLYLNPTYPAPSSISTKLLSANSKLKLYQHKVDLLLRRFYNPNPHLRMRLIGGLTFFKINNKMKFDYLYVDATNYVENFYKYLATGLKLGLDFDWFWGRDIYLTGRAIASSLIGKYKNRSLIYPSTTLNPVSNAFYEDYRLAYEIDFLFGFSYQKSFTNNRMELFLGYELNSYFNIHEIIKSTGDTTKTTARVSTINNGILSLHGLTSRFTFDF